MFYERIYKEEKIKKFIIIFLIISLININFVYAKYAESLIINYEGKIAKPIFIIEYNDKKIIDNLEEIVKDHYLFTIKNYNESDINQIELYYQFQIVGINENISFELKNLITGEIVKFENNLSPKIKLGIDKEEYQYSLSIDFEESIIDKNIKIDLKINTYFKKEEI